MNNTRKKGQFRFVIYKKPGDNTYTGICLDLDIVEENQDPVFLKKSLEEAAQGYLEAVCKNKLSDKLLNKTTPKKYWDVLEDLEKYFHRLLQISEFQKPLPLQDSQVFTKNINDFVCV